MMQSEDSGEVSMAEVRRRQQRFVALCCCFCWTFWPAGPAWPRFGLPVGLAPKAEFVGLGGRGLFAGNTSRKTSIGVLTNNCSATVEKVYYSSIDNRAIRLLRDSPPL
jgi:hypothetical protein